MLADLKCSVILVVLNNTSKISRQIICKSCHIIYIVFVKWFTEPSQVEQIEIKLTGGEETLTKNSCSVCKQNELIVLQLTSV